jgi:FMN phosphatase YigB (HAD superfamily)
LQSRHANLTFDAIFSGDLLKSYKPNREMYLGACKLLDLKPEEVGLVASHIYDLRAAASFGVRSLLQMFRTEVDVDPRGQLKTIYVPRKTEDRTGNIENFDGPESVKRREDGGEVDSVITSFGELSSLAASL